MRIHTGAKPGCQRKIAWSFFLQHRRRKSRIASSKSWKDPRTDCGLRVSASHFLSAAKGTKSIIPAAFQIEGWLGSLELGIFFFVQAARHDMRAGRLNCVDTVRHREIGTSISEVSERVASFLHDARGSKQMSCYFRQRK